MFCSKCGKTIDDDALICPECGAVTLNGIIALKDKENANQANNSQGLPSSPILEEEKNSKALRIVAIILGLVGSANLLSSLLMEYASVSAPIVGSVTVSMSEHLDALMLFVFFLAVCGIVSSLAKFAISQIFTGLASVVWAILMWVDTQNSEAEGSYLVSVSYGFGYYWFLLGAVLILVSGILFAIAKSRTKSIRTNNDNSKKKEINKKAIGITVGILVAVCAVVFSIFAIIFIMPTVRAKKTVAIFMNSAIKYDVNSMNNTLSDQLNDKNGFMEAYSSDIMSKALLSGIGLEMNDLDDRSKACINESSERFGRNYLKKYTVEEATKNEDGTFTVTVHAAIIDMSDSYKKIRTDTSELINDYVNAHPDEVDDLYVYYYYDDKVVEKLMIKLMPEVSSIINESIKNAGEKDTEFSFVVEKMDNEYKIIEIDYTD